MTTGPQDCRTARPQDHFAFMQLQILKKVISLKYPNKSMNRIPQTEYHAILPGFLAMI